MTTKCKQTTLIFQRMAIIFDKFEEKKMMWERKSEKKTRDLVNVKVKQSQTIDKPLAHAWMLFPNDVWCVMELPTIDYVRYMVLCLKIAQFPAQIGICTENTIFFTSRQFAQLVLCWGFCFLFVFSSAGEDREFDSPSEWHHHRRSVYQMFLELCVIDWLCMT